MDGEHIKSLAGRLLSGELSESNFLAEIASLRSLRTPDATIDLDRQRRCGAPEVVFAEGKSTSALVGILEAQIDLNGDAFATRVSAAQADAVKLRIPSVRYNPIARTLRGAPSEESGDEKPGGDHSTKRGVAIITAGTSDFPVAEEARETLDWMNVDSKFICDVGVAGPHRLAERFAEFADACAIIVVAGMEGALPSVVGGFVACPVVAVPTSVGYGASFGGVAALLGMLNSCASNVVVVNIDAGFKAAYVAGIIARQVATCEP